MEDVIKDSRFAHIASDPRFKSIPHSQRHVKIDKRFQGMFKDKRFKLKYTVDKRGRPITRTSNEDLERYYALSSGSDEDDSESDSQITIKGKDKVLQNEARDTDRKKGKPKKAEKSKQKVGKKVKSKQLKMIAEEDTEGEEDNITTEEDDVLAKVKEYSEEESEEDTDGDSEEDENQSDHVRSDDEEITDAMKSKLQDMSVDYARGEGALLSDSSSDEESSDEDEEEAVEHGWGELDKDAERSDEITRRLAVCNMDWDRIRAVDLMVLFNSFTPASGLVQSVTIYPSEFGLERMKKEEEQGPTELVERNNQSSDEDDVDDAITVGVEENEEGSRYHMEKLRQYQLNRLKYYYAIVVCDTPTTANHIYTECDGMEYESSATRLDLRFVPDDTTFDQEPRETCSEMPDTKKYRPRHFTTTALQQAKVELTWDETDPTRTEIANRLLSGDNVDDSDLKAYLASSSEDDGEDETTCKGGEQRGKSSRKKNMGEGSISLKNGASNTDVKGDATDGSGSEDGDPITKYRSLLASIEEEQQHMEDKGVQMEISWGLGLKEKAEEAVKKRMTDAVERTPFQELMEKRKQKRKEKKKQRLQQKMDASKIGSEEDTNPYSDDDIPSDVDMNDPYFAEEFKNQPGVKKEGKKNKKKKGQQEDTEEERQKKAELELLLMEKDDQKHFNFKKIQEAEEKSNTKKKKKWRSKLKQEKALKAVADSNDDFQVNVSDDRFSALFSSHHFNIDPTDPHFRKSRGMDALVTAKQKRVAESREEPPSKKPNVNRDSASSKPRKDAELSVLVKSVKRRTQNLRR